MKSKNCVPSENQKVREDRRNNGRLKIRKEKVVKQTRQGANSNPQ